VKKTFWSHTLLIIGWLIGSIQLGWTEVRPGDVISDKNVTQAEGLLTPATRWMVERGMPIQIVKSKQVRLPAAYQEATDKYADQVELSADGRELSHYVAGLPFPQIDINDPLAGFKIMWNYEQKPYDNVGSSVTLRLINNKGEVDRIFPDRWRRLKWTGRLWLDPKPTVPHTPALTYTDLLGPSPFPFPDAIGPAFLLSFRYLAPNAADDTYWYDPLSRRVGRITEMNRGALVTSDVDFDSLWGFNAKVSFWTFRVLAEKEILAIVHSGKYGDSSIWCSPQDESRELLGAFPCAPWEKRRVWVVEGIPTRYLDQYPNYSKRILYVDQEFFGILMGEMYNLNGELWKYILSCFFYTRSPYDGFPTYPLEGGKYNYTEEWPFIPNGLMGDMQRNYVTTFDAPGGNTGHPEWQDEWYFNEDTSVNTPAIYDADFLLKSMR